MYVGVVHSAVLLRIDKLIHRFSIKTRTLTRQFRKSIVLSHAYQKEWKCKGNSIAWAEVVCSIIHSLWNKHLKVKQMFPGFKQTSIHSLENVSKLILPCLSRLVLCGKCEDVHSPHSTCWVQFHLLIKFMRILLVISSKSHHKALIIAKG